MRSHHIRNRRGKREKWNARLGDKSDVDPYGHRKYPPNVSESFDRNFNGRRSFNERIRGRERETASRCGIDRYWQQVDSTYGCAVRTMYLVRLFVLRHSSPFPEASYENLIRRYTVCAQEFTVKVLLLASRDRKRLRFDNIVKYSYRCYFTLKNV